MRDDREKGVGKVDKLAAAICMSHLLILGECLLNIAHHCARDHPANKIISDYYYPSLFKEGPVAVPHILGLTASLIQRSKASELKCVVSMLLCEHVLTC
jgi:hypothetical protein